MSGRWPARAATATAAAERGTVSLTALGVTLTLALIFAAVIMLVQLSARVAAAGEERGVLLVELRKQAREVIEQLMAADAANEPVRSPLHPLLVPQQAEPGGDYRVTLTDASSAFGIHWIRKGMLEHSGVMNGASAAAELQQFREDGGGGLTLDRFAGFFRGDQWRSLFTTYSFFNVNLTDEFVLRQLHRTRTGDDAGATAFHAAIQQLLMDQQLLSATELTSLLGAAEARLFPLLNTEPPINVNFAPQRVLEILLSYEPFAVDDWQTVSAALVIARQSTPLDRAGLTRLIGPRFEQTRLGQYLGDQTWFWRIEIEANDGTWLRWVVARIPSSGESAAPSYRLVSEEHA